MSQSRIRTFPHVPSVIVDPLAQALSDDGTSAAVTTAPPDLQNGLDWALVAMIALYVGDKVAGEFIEQSVADPIKALREKIVMAYRWAVANPAPFRSIGGETAHGPAINLALPVTVGAMPMVCDFIYMRGIDEPSLETSFDAIAEVMRTITAAGTLLHAGLQSTLADPQFYLGPSGRAEFLVDQANERWSGFRDAFVGKWIFHPGDRRWVRAPA